MNKYTELSDFEINKKVAEALGINIEETVVFKNGGEDIKNHSSDLVLMKKISSNRKFWKIYAPCNNPADAMPIIIENKIAMNPKDDIWQCGSGWTVAENKNPLRACMEAYLMKKDAENEKV